MLVTGNEIDHFGDDGIDYGASNISITKNYIHDPMEWRSAHTSTACKDIRADLSRLQKPRRSKTS